MRKPRFGEVRLIDRRQHNSRWLRRSAIAMVAMLLIELIGGFGVVAGAQEVSELEINSTAYIVIDADTGEIFAQKNAHDHRAMASLTKVFTAIEALKRAPVDLTVTTQDSDVYNDESTRVGFGAGEQFTLLDLLYGMLLPSGNDAAHAIARDIGAQPGDTDPDQGYERFISWMNERIKLMGLQDTNLVNPHGWGVPNHYSTAYDLATFMRYAVQDPTFLDIIGTSSYTTTNGYSFTNTNKLLNTDGELLGGKTGYDDDAGYCLIEVARRDGRTMISVTLDGVAPDDWYDDNVVLLNYAFDQAAARGGVIEGEVASYTNPDVAVLSSAATTGGIQGVASTGNAAAAQPTTTTATTAESPKPEQAAANEQAQSSGSVDRRAPGLTRNTALAFLIALAFIILAGRALWKADVGFAALALPRLKQIRPPSFTRFTRAAGEPGDRPHQSSD